MLKQIIQMLLAVFVFYHCIINYHKFSSLKQYSFFVYFHLTVLRSKIKVNWAGVSARKAEIKVQTDSVLSGVQGHIPNVPVTGRIQFLEFVGLKSLFPFWLLASVSSRTSQGHSDSFPVGYHHLSIKEPPSGCIPQAFLISLTSPSASSQTNLSF